MTTATRPATRPFPLRQQPPGRRRRLPPVVLGVALLAVLVGFAGSWIPFGWTDEDATLALIRRPLPELWTTVTTQIDAVHALYYLAVKLLTTVTGSDLIVIRAVSAIGVGVGTVGVWAVGRLLRDDRTGLLAALVFLAMPSVTWAAGEARSYAWVMAAAAWTAFCWFTALDGSRIRQAQFVLVAVVSVYLFEYLLLVVLALLGPALVTERGRARARMILLTAAVVLLCTTPLLVLSIQQQRQVNWLSGLSWNTLYSVGVQWFLRSKLYPVPGWLLIVAGVVVAARDPRLRPRLPAIIAWLVVPTLVLVLATAAGKPSYLQRYTLVSLPAAALLIGVACRRFRRADLVPVALLAVLSIPTYVQQRTPTAKDVDWGYDVDWMTSHARDGGGVYFGDPGDPKAPLQMTVQYGTRLTALRDVSFAAPPHLADGLFPAPAALPAVLQRVTSMRQVFVVLDNTDSDAQRTLQRFEATGLQQTGHLAGPFTTVTEFTQPGG